VATQRVVTELDLQKVNQNQELRNSLPLADQVRATRSTRTFQLELASRRSRAATWPINIVYAARSSSASAKRELAATPLLANFPSASVQ
jgi:hypothetical protein